ncbi:MAG: PHP domain-containing protein, partial [Actinomycetota bacterium]
MSSFVHLHTHSNYSLREGAAYVCDLAAAAAEMGCEALALTDHDGMYGAVRFTLACRGAGIRPILGTELEWGPGYHATLLAADARGWANLCRLVTEMHLSYGTARLAPGKRPRTSFERIAHFSEGVFALSGCNRGEIASLAAAGRTDEAQQAARRWLEVFGADRFAIEVTNHLEEGDALRTGRLNEIAKALGVRTAATNNVHYTTQKDGALHDILDCIRRIVPLSAVTAPRKNHEYWLKPPEEMARLHDGESIDAAAWVAKQCRYELPLGEFHFPDPIKTPSILG